MAVNRDEALDAIWPDLNPEAGGNSLHQAIYYLRRVVEPDFREGMSAGYVQVDGEVVSLHPTLVDTASRECWRLLRQDRRGDGAAMDRLLGLYRGRYALDFAYEDWAAHYRENLHAAVLAAVEVAQVRARIAEDFDRAIRLGHDALDGRSTGRRDRAGAGEGLQGQRSPSGSGRAVRALRSLGAHGTRRRAALIRRHLGDRGEGSERDAPELRWCA